MLWDAEKSRPIRVLHTNQSGLRSASVSPDGDAVVVGDRDGTLLVLDLETGQSRTTLPRQTMPVNCVRFSPDATRIAVALGELNSNDQGQVRLINLQTGASEIFHCNTAPGAITFVSNDELIIGQWNGHATLWNLIQHKIVGAANADKNIIAAVSFSPDNPQLREIAFKSPGINEL
jgi:WD40 repeat protein